MRDTGETARPDVSVIVAVYNTMPYLTECLTSLVEQSIGRDRLEVIAVDDGSDDGSEKELDRFAALHPETVRVLHQANSGGPAAPSNRGLELATGRYVFFIGSDDYLGPEALERMVRVADERGSDVVAGKMVGVNGRGVHEELFDRPVGEVSLYDSTLPWAVSNTKLFRRELIERHGLRYPEDLPVGSDQPFTLEALIRAERITVLGDYDYYFAVRRASDGNITYRSGHETRLDCTARIMDFVAGLLEAGPRRDAVLRRHFAAELWKLLQPDLLELDEETQRRVCEGVARLADTYLTETISDGLVVKRRARLAVARSRNLAALRASIAFQGAPPFVLEKGRAYAAYPGFRTADPEVPDRCFEVLNEGVTGRVVDCVGTASAETRPDAVVLSARVALIGAGAAEPAPVRVGAVRLERGAPPARPRWVRKAKRPKPELSAEVTLERSPGGTETLVVARFPVARLPVSAKPVRWSVRLYADLGDRVYDIPVPLAAPGARRTHRKGLRWHRVAVAPDEDGRSVLVLAPLAVSRALAGRVRRLLPGLDRK